MSPIHTVEIYDLATLDGTASQDPGGGEVVGYRWSVSSSGAPCEPPTVASAEPWTRVRFGCAGDYALSLVVVNDLGIESEALTTTVRALPSVRPSVIAAGGDLTREHLCRGSPLLCTTAQLVALEGRSADPSLSFLWSVEPPVGRDLLPARRVRFAPDRTSSSPQVIIESDGLSIAGDWIFRVEARDVYGVVGAAYQRVSVTNRPPVITPGTASVTAPHTFDAARSVFTAAGEVTFLATDPDGDPVQVTPTFRHVGDCGALFAGQVNSTSSHAAFTVEVPYTEPDDAFCLIDGDGLERAVELLARDANGAETRLSVPVEIGNRPPVLARAPVTLSVPHRFDPATSQYLASAELGEWTDPDGDPIEIAPGSAPCPDLSMVNGTVTASCSAPYAGVPAADQLVGARSIAVRVSDPWNDATASGNYVLTIRDSPPSITAATAPATVHATWIPIITTGGAIFIIDATQFTATPAVADPDGDPILVRAVQSNGGSANPTEAVCSGGPCLPFLFSQPEIRMFRCSFCPPPVYTPPSWLVASDGAASVSIPVSPAPQY